MQKKPGLMIAVLEGLKKKGKLESDDHEGYEDEVDYREQLEAISKDFIKAIMAKDEIAIADLLEEAFDCLEQRPHVEGPHLEED